MRPYPVSKPVCPGRTGGLADWRTGGLADWRTGGLAEPAVGRLVPGTTTVWSGLIACGGTT